jgi:solute carrier family 25 S-adenosylmethionine transporter 26
MTNVNRRRLVSSLTILPVLLILQVVLCALTEHASAARSSVLAAASLPRKRSTHRRQSSIHRNIRNKSINDTQSSSSNFRYANAIPNGGALVSASSSAIPAVHVNTATITATTPSAPAWSDGLKNGLASALAAACVKCSLQPIDAIKTLQQYHQASAATGTGTASSLTMAAACRSIMARPGGFTNFYAGLGVTVFGAMPSVGLYFGVYSYCKRRLLATEKGQRNRMASIATSAAIGNSVASFSRVPYEVIKQKLQTGVYTSTWEALRDVARQRQWWACLFPKGGVAIQMLRDVPYAVCTLLLYESLQTACTTNWNVTSSSTSKGVDFCLGGIAGGLGSWVTNPMDVVKTRLQVNSDLYSGSVWKCTQLVWQEGGASAFLRGSIPRLFHKIPANAFFFLFYELFRRVLRVEEAVAKHEQQKIRDSGTGIKGVEVVASRRSSKR